MILSLIQYQGYNPFRVYLYMKIQPELHPEIIAKYQNGDSSAELAEEYICSPTSILNVLKRHNIVTRKRKYVIRENYFENIDSVEKAYFLGLLYADGTNIVDTGINLILQERDKHILEEFQKLLSIDGGLPIISIPTTTNIIRGKECQVQPKYGLRICSQKFSNDLENQGLVNPKTSRNTIPNFSKEYLVDFVRGYFDGDGCLSYYTDNTLRGKVTFSVHEEFGKTLQQVLKQTLNINLQLRKLVSSEVFSLEIQGNRQILKLLNWIYQNSQAIKLNRKYEKFNKFKEAYKDIKCYQYPDSRMIAPKLGI